MKRNIRTGRASGAAAMPGQPFAFVYAGNTHERAGSTCRTRSLSRPGWTLHTTPAFGVAFQDPDGLHARRLKVDELRRLMAYPDAYRFAAPGGRAATDREKAALLGDGVTPLVLEFLTQRCLDTLA